jgi:hypothetical protein
MASDEGAEVFKELPGNRAAGHTDRFDRRRTRVSSDSQSDWGAIGLSGLDARKDLDPARVGLSFSLWPAKSVQAPELMTYVVLRDRNARGHSFNNPNEGFVMQIACGEIANHDSPLWAGLSDCSQWKFRGS